MRSLLPFCEEYENITTYKMEYGTMTCEVRESCAVQMSHSVLEETWMYSTQFNLPCPEHMVSVHNFSRSVP